MDLASLGKAAAKFGVGRVFPPTGRGLSDALIAACGRADSVLGCGFGDTLSTNLAGRYDEVDQFASLLVVAALSGRVEEFAVVCVDANQEDFDENVIGVEPITFLAVLARELHEEVRGRAKISGSPLFGWFSLLQGDATLGELGGLRRAQQEIAGRLGEIPALNVARVVTALGGRVALAPPKLGDWGLVGRDDDLATLHERLQHHGRATVVPVAGLGGLGKTALALGYLAVYGDRYDLVAWVDAERPELIVGQYRSLVRNRTGVVVPESEATAAALALLAGSENWLVIFDNAASSDEIHPFLPSGSGRVLVTTRNETWTANQRLEFRLDKLSRAEVAAWIIDAAPGSDAATVDELAERLDGLPLAVVQALAYITARPGETAASYLAKLKTKAGQKQVLAAGRPAGYPAAVATTWDVAVDAIAVDKPAALRLLRFLAYVNANNIPAAILDGLAGDDSAGDLIEVLARYGMVRYAASQVSMHRLVQDVTRWPLSIDEESEHVTGWAAHFGCPWPSRGQSNFAWYAAAAPHLLTLIDHADSLHIVLPRLASKARWTSESLMTQAAYTTARELLQGALAINEAFYGPNRPEVTETRSELANAHHRLGEYDKAVELYQRAVDINAAFLGPNRPEVVANLTDLGDTYRRMGDYAEAVELYHRAVSITDNPETVWQGAEWPPVPIDLSTHGDDIILTELGNAYRWLGDYAKTVELCQKALAFSESTYGPDHPRVARCLTDLGNAHLELGDTAKALELCQRALAIYKEPFGDDHPTIATTLNGLGNAHLELGDTAKALELCQRALAINEAVYGPDHPDVATNLANLANAYLELGDDPQALQLLHRVLGIFEVVYGASHPDAVKARSMLAQPPPDDSSATTLHRWKLAVTLAALDVWLSGRPGPRGVALLAEALGDQRWRYDSNPTPRQQKELAATLNTLGRWLADGPEKPRGLALLAEAVGHRRELYESKPSPENRRELAVTLGQLGCRLAQGPDRPRGTALLAEAHRLFRPPTQTE